MTYPQYKMAPSPSPCGGTLAWFRRYGQAWESVGCVCHHHCDGTPLDKPRPLGEAS